MVALVVLGTIAVPLRMAGSGLRALLNRGLAAPVAAGMEALAREALGELPIRRLYIRAVQPGRTAYIAVHVLLPTDAALDLAAADRLRGRVITALAARHGPAIVDVVFTAVEDYAAPTTGFRTAAPSRGRRRLEDAGEALDQFLVGIEERVVRARPCPSS